MDAQMKRGLIEACILKLLLRGDSYGYQLVREAEAHKMYVESVHEEPCILPAKREDLERVNELRRQVNELHVQAAPCQVVVRAKGEDLRLSSESVIGAQVQDLLCTVS